MRKLYPLLNLAQLLFLIVWSVFWISLALLITMLTFNRDIALAMARRFWAPGLRWVGGITLECEPLPKIDFRQPYIFAMNHQSMFDIVAAFIFIPQNLRFIAKESLKYVPFLGWYMWMTGMVFVDRGKRERAVRSLERAGQQIRQGASILVYPEGTRSADGQILPFKKGPFVVAIQSGVPIVPVAIEGSGVCLPKGGFRVRSGVVRLKMGEPISTAELRHEDRDQLIRKVRDALIDLHLSIGGRGGDKAYAIAEAGQEGFGKKVEGEQGEGAEALRAG